ncbi:MAG: hypothetical protein DRH08_00625 [Deltaproteobacteria bacterium]|nr:MAG: hypothetical protein DRH08_00625 [Deltaproteobacteria bacterium]
MSEQITCAESDELRKGLKPWASCTNYVGGEVINPPPFPPHTQTEWSDDDRVVRLIDTLDADGCRHQAVEIDMKEDDDVDDTSW